MIRDRVSVSTLTTRFVNNKKGVKTSEECRSIKIILQHLRCLPSLPRNALFVLRIPARTRRGLPTRFVTVVIYFVFSPRSLFIRRVRDSGVD